MSLRIAFSHTSMASRPGASATAAHVALTASVATSGTSRLTKPASCTSSLAHTGIFPPSLACGASTELVQMAALAASHLHRAPFRESLCNCFVGSVSFCTEASSCSEEGKPPTSIDSGFAQSLARQICALRQAAAPAGEDSVPILRGLDPVPQAARRL